MQQNNFKCEMSISATSSVSWHTHWWAQLTEKSASITNNPLTRKLALRS